MNKKDEIIINNDDIIMATSSKKKDEFKKFMKKHKKPFNLTIDYKEHQFSLLFYSLLFMADKYYHFNSPNNSVTVKDIIDEESFDAYYESLPGIPDFVFLYIMGKIFELQTVSLRKPKVNLWIKDTRNTEFIQKDMKWYFKDYYKNNFDLFYQHIYKLCNALFEMQHPLFNGPQVEFFIHDILITFIIDRSNIDTTATFGPKYQKDIDAVSKKTLLNMTKMTFLSYKECYKDSDEITYPLHTYFSSFRYYNIPIILKYIDVFFENENQKYDYILNCFKVFNYYFESIKNYKKNIEGQKTHLKYKKKPRKMTCSAEDLSLYKDLIKQTSTLLNQSSYYNIRVSNTEYDLITKSLSYSDNKNYNLEIINALNRMVIANNVISKNKHVSNSGSHRARL